MHHLRRGMYLTSTAALSGAASPPSAGLITAIAANGWEATWASGTPTVADPNGGTPTTVAGTRQGFNATGAAAPAIPYNWTVTTRVRQPVTSSTDFLTTTFTADRVALHEYVYASDSIPGVTNGSAEVSPKPVAQWAQRTRQLIDGTFLPEIVAFHRDGIACVRFIATDGTNTVTADVSTMAVSGRASDLQAVLVYRPPANFLAALADGPITLNAMVFPRFGAGDPNGANAAAAGSILRTQDQTAETRLFSAQVHRKCTAGTAGARWVIYVDAAGSDATGVASQTAATAAASPVATLHGAIQRARVSMGNALITALEIRLRAGTWTFTQAPTFINGGYQDLTNGGAIVITRDPAVDKANVTYTLTAANFSGSSSTGYLEIRDINISRSSTANQAGGIVSLVECNLDNNSQNSTIQASGRALFVEGLIAINSSQNTFNSGQQVRLMRGVSVSGSSQVDPWNVLGCRFPNGPSFSGALCTFAYNVLTAGSLVGVGVTEADGFAIVQNVFEFTSATSNPSLRISADANTNNVTHPIVWHNTFAGANLAGRGNILYDDTAATLRTHKLQSFVGNLHAQLNYKSDRFKASRNDANASQAIGAWGYMYGVGCRGEFSMYADAGPNRADFRQDFPGLAASLGTSNSGRNDPLFVGALTAATTFNGSTYTAGTGGGNWRLQASSPAKARVPRSALPFDLDGAPRAATGSCGAYE